jgi:hypothetical protein
VEFVKAKSEAELKCLKEKVASLELLFKKFEKDHHVLMTLLSMWGFAVDESEGESKESQPKKEEG